MAQLPPPNRPTPFTQTQFSQTFGGGMICVLIMMPIFGSSVLQMYLYNLNYPNDGAFLKLLSSVVLILGTLHAGFAFYTMWEYLVASYSDPSILIDGKWPLYADSAIAVVIVCLVQGFFIRMINQLLINRRTTRVLLTTILVLLTLAQLVFGVYFSVKLVSLGQILQLHKAVFPVLVPMLSLRVLADVIIAVALCTILYESRTKFGRSLKIIKSLIVYSMNRFVLTTIIVIGQTAALIIKSENVGVMLIEFVSVQLYIASFFSSLNTRNHLRGITRAEAEYITKSERSHASIPLSRLYQLDTSGKADREKAVSFSTNSADNVQDPKVQGSPYVANWKDMDAKDPREVDSAQSYIYMAE